MTPPSRSHTSMDARVRSSWSTPEDLITESPLSRSSSEALPQVKTTRPCLGRPMFASYTLSRSSLSIMRSLLSERAKVPVPFARQRAKVPAPLSITLTVTSFMPSPQAADTGATDEDVEILKEAGIHEVVRVG